MPAYNSTQFDPPAPVASVILRHPQTNAALEILMLIDSGADVTLIPQYAATQLGISLVENRNYELAGFDGTVSFAPVIQAEAVFAGRAFRGQFLLIEQEWGIIGRNILNAIPLLLDGPKLNWEAK